MSAVSLDAIFKAYDIRGTVPDQLDADIARAIGSAFARFARAPRILVAHDMRESGPELAVAFAEGVRREDVEVVHMGLASTDMIYFASGRLDAPGAMLTASHNPAGYNGIKLCLAGARPVGVESGLLEIKQTTEALLTEGDTRPLRGGETTVDLLDEFVTHVHSFIDISALRPMKVVADTANGMGGLIVPTRVREAADRARHAVPRARRHVSQPSGRSDPAGEPARPAGSRDRGARGPRPRLRR